MTEIKKQIADALCAAAGGALDAETLCAAFEYPPSADMGDLAFPCFRLSKTLRKAPPAIAAELAQGFSAPAVSRVEVAGGYLNLFLDKDYLVRHVIDRTLHTDVPYGSSEDGKGKTVVLDYSSPNVAKPFHIGHLGTTVIGHSLKKLHAFAGWHCIGINHLGDWGTQFGKLIVAYRKWGSREAVEAGEIDELVALYVKFHAEAEKDPSLEDAARAEFTKLEHGDAENLALWKWFIEISLREYKKTYALLGIEFDSYNGESFYTDKMPRQVEILREKNLLTLDDGASIVDLGKYNMPPCLILKRDGSTLYPTRDIAAAVYRMDTYHFDKCIYVTSAGQSLHFAQWFKVVELMGYDWYDRLVHVPYGTVSIDGAKLATRTGNVVLLKDLFATAIEKARAIIEEKNPTLENKDEVAKQVGVGAIGAAPTGGAIKVTSPEEGELAKVLTRFPERVAAAIAEYEPSDITRYILDLCAAFNRFYHECPILSAEDADVRDTRLALVSATSEVLGNALDLICMGKPEQI